MVIVKLHAIRWRVDVVVGISIPIAQYLELYPYASIILRNGDARNCYF